MLDEIGEVAAELNQIPDELRFCVFTCETLDAVNAKIRKCSRDVSEIGLKTNQNLSSMDATVQEA